MCLEIMKAEVLVYAPGGRGNRCQCGAPVTQRPAEIAGVRKRGSWRRSGGGPRSIWLWFSCWGSPTLESQANPSIWGCCHQQMLWPEAGGDTHVAEQVGFSRESSQPSVQVSQEAGLTKGSGFSGLCVGAVSLQGLL